MRQRHLLRSTEFAWAVVAAAAVLLLLSVLVLINSADQAAPTESTKRGVTVSLEKDEKLRVAYIGDSLTAGLFATTEEDTFRDLTTTVLADGAPVEEEGRQLVGGTVQQTLDGNKQLPQGQHLYIVELGTNDVNEVDFRTFSRQYKMLLERVQEASPDAALVCLGTWRPPSKGSSYDLVIRQVCESYDGEYRRMSDLEDEPTNKGPEDEDTYQGLSDDFHPNDAGHAAISERLVNAIEVQRAG